MGSAGGALSGAASGAMTGSQILPGWGTAIGGVIGGIGGFLTGDDEADAQAEAQAAQLAFMEAQAQAQAVARAEEMKRATLGREEGFQEDAVRFLKASQDAQRAGTINQPMLDRLASLNPAFAGAAGALSSGVYGGGFFNRELERQQAINQALEQGGLASAQAIDEATDEQLGNIKGRAMRQGFTGAGSGEIGALARARAAGRRNAATDLATARIKQQMGLADVTGRDINRQLSHLTSSADVMNAEAQARLSPALAEAKLFASRSPGAFTSFKGLEEGAAVPAQQQMDFYPNPSGNRAAFEGAMSNLGRFAQSEAGQNMFKGWGKNEGTATVMPVGTGQPYGGSWGTPVNTQPVGSPTPQWGSDVQVVTPNAPTFS